MTRFAWLAVLVPVALLVAVHGCQGPDTFLRNSAPGTGGSTIEPDGTGGSGTGGMAIGTGGMLVGTGGRMGTGGTPGGTGGMAMGTGGMLAGTGGRTGTGGRMGTGGMAVGTGGAPAGTGGATTDAGTGTGGTPGTGGAGSGNCIDDIIGASYTTTTGVACSMCLENGMSLETKCKAMLNCLAPSWPNCASGSNCWTNCLNMAAGSGVVASCVQGMTATCP